MWLRLDYTYVLAANAKVVLGTLFVVGALWSGSYPVQMVASGLTSLAAALLARSDSHRTVTLYLSTSPQRSGTAQ